MLLNIRIFLFLLVFVSISTLTTSSASAQDATDDASGIAAVDLLVLAAVGGGYPDHGGMLLVGRLRRLPETPLGLEFGFYAPWGVGANLLIDVYRTERWRVHLLDPGVFYVWEPRLNIVRTDVRRAVDITFGAGVEWQFAPQWWVTLDCRMYFPEPIRTIGWYGDFARRIYAASAAGVQTWLGIGYSF
ncbi:MAG: hypothetical protein V1738_04805 [Patescibacteria group bacterium]